MASTYSTWEYYRDTYHGTLGEGDYSRMAIRAAGEINQRTFGRAQTAPGEMAGALCDCECELVDALTSFDQSYALIPQGISSIANDGLSATTSVGTSRTDSREDILNSQVRQICRKYLLRPVNLLYAGMRRC